MIEDARLALVGAVATAIERHDRGTYGTVAQRIEERLAERGYAIVAVSPAESEIERTVIAARLHEMAAGRFG